ncbi:MAG TPA: formylglycine-generating enzyme family protein [Magnetococcales bacterium]|nr:formylglycine-generating enzyme family protein [Magnetococcales bacterium]
MQTFKWVRLLLVSGLVVSPGSAWAGEKQKPFADGKAVSDIRGEVKSKPGENKDATGEMAFVTVAGGTFQMGCGAWQKDCLGNEKPAHAVQLKSFEIGKYEVTQGQWKEIMGENPSDFLPCGDLCPVDGVLWDDVQTFITNLNARNKGCTYRLPTEAEWEYACRSGGKPEIYCGGNDPDAVAWYRENSRYKTHPVGLKAPNGLGLYDMSGNVNEWVYDKYDSLYYANSPQDNPQGSASGSDRVFRGGGWYLGAVDIRSTLRSRNDPSEYSTNMGFRLVRTCH